MWRRAHKNNSQCPLLWHAVHFGAPNSRALSSEHQRYLMLWNGRELFPDSYSQPRGKTCFGGNSAASIRLLPQPCKQQPVVCWPRSFKWITKQNCLCCQSSPLPCVNPSSFFRPSPNLVAKEGWRLLCNAIAGTHPHIKWQQVLLGPCWDPAQAGSLD